MLTLSEDEPAVGHQALTEGGRQDSVTEGESQDPGYRGLSPAAARAPGAGSREKIGLGPPENRGGWGLENRGGKDLDDGGKKRQ